ncbi:MAG: hypothetical protein JXP34_09920 [Planctomycetes bacterium]|nr:hypothetical protein [Planctomycetota bacterium]
MRKVIASFVRSFPVFKQDEDDLLGILWIELDRELLRADSTVRAILTEGLCSPHATGRFTRYVQAILRHWGTRHQSNRALILQESFAEDEHSGRLSASGFGCRLAEDPAQEFEWREFAEIFVARLRNSPRRLDLLLAEWVEAGCDPSAAAALGLSRATLYRARQRLLRLYRELSSPRRRTASGRLAGLEKT